MVPGNEDNHSSERARGGKRVRESIIANGPRLTQEWLDSTKRFRDELLEEMGGVPFKRGEIAEMIREGREDRL